MPLDGDLPRRDRELVPRRTSKAYEELLKTFHHIRRGFEDQGDRADDILDYWKIYNCKLSKHQFYNNGNARIFVPIVANAVDARTTRFLNQIFPSSGRYIDATSTDSGVPHAMVALLESYVRNTALRTQIMSSLLRCGDIEGHYHLYCDWERAERHVISRETRAPQVAIGGMPGAGNDADRTVIDISEEVLVDQMPALEVIHDTDVLVLPVTARSIDDALRQGGEVVIIRRWTKETLRQMIDSGELAKGPGETLLEMSERDDIRNPTRKEHIDAAGIKAGGKIFQIYEAWKVLDVPDEGRRLCRAWYGGFDIILGARRNPYWNDRCPLLSTPQKKIAGVFKGTSQIAKVDSLQYHANDIANQAADSATYSMIPFIMTDPAQNPRTSTLIMNLGAVWEVNPNSTRFAEWPKLWQDGIAIIQADTTQIFQTLGVNPAMLPQQTGKPGAKRNQAEIALEQTVDLLTTAESCSVIEEGIMTPMLEQWIDLDHQFRDNEITVKTFGEIGMIAKMETVPPQQNRTRLNFTWFGVEQARNAAQIQQQIAFLNVARGLSADLTKAGYMLNPAPALEHAAGQTFGWRMGRQIVQDMRQQFSMDPEVENGMLVDGIEVAVHPLDQDPIHIQAHFRMIQETGDPTGEGRMHLQRHMASMQIKAQGMMQRGMPGMQQGQPQAQPQGGVPLPGAQPAGPKLVRGPAGAIHPDQMPRAGAVGMPRKM